MYIAQFLDLLYHLLIFFRLNPFNSQFNTSYYEGLHRLLGGLNPWLVSIALPGDTLRKTKGYSTQVLSWVQAISAYNLTGEDRKSTRLNSSHYQQSRMPSSA